MINDEFWTRGVPWLFSSSYNSLDLWILFLTFDAILVGSEIKEGLLDCRLPFGNAKERRQVFQELFTIAMGYLREHILGIPSFPCASCCAPPSYWLCTPPPSVTPASPFATLGTHLTCLINIHIHACEYPYVNIRFIPRKVKQMKAIGLLEGNEMVEWLKGLNFLRSDKCCTRLASTKCWFHPLHSLRKPLHSRWR